MLDANAFSVLSFIAGPALLTNATTIFLLGTTNRYGRALDRWATLSGALSETGQSPNATTLLELRQLEQHQQRILLIVRAMTALYVAVGGFALGTLSFLIGIGLGAKLGLHAADIATTVSVVSTLSGVVFLIGGASVLTWESLVSYGILRYETGLVRSRTTAAATARW